MENTDQIEGNRKLIDDDTKKLPKFIYVVSVLSAVGGFLFGYDTGVVSGAMMLIKDHFLLNSTWIELIVSSTIGAAWVFSIVAGDLTERFGRKPVIIIASFVFTAGAVMMGLSREKYLLLGGRIVVGIGIGLSSMTVPMYIGEIAPLEIRGKLLTINNCFITGGQFVASVVCGLFSKDKLNGWRYMLGLAGIPSFIQFFCFLYMPESPRWLISKERYDEAVIVLKKLTKSSPEAEQEAESIHSNIHIEKEQQGGRKGSLSTFIKVLHCPSVRRALIVGCSLQMFQQISGINTVMYYSALIIQMAGVDDVSKAIWLSAATAAVNFVFTFVGLLLVERIGRRPLTLGSLAGVVLSLGLLGIGFQLSNLYSASVHYHNLAQNTDCSKASSCAECINFADCGYCFQKSPSGPHNSSCLSANKMSPGEMSSSGNCSSTEGDFLWGHEWCPTDYSWLILLGMLLYLCFFAPGMGPMPWTVNSELYPQWARSTCYSVATSFTWLFNIIISMTFLTLSHSITRYGAFYLYMGFAIIGWIFIFFTLPETKGRTFEEVGNQFSNSLCQVKHFYCNKESAPYVEMDSSQKKNDSISHEETSY